MLVWITLAVMAIALPIVYLSRARAYFAQAVQYFHKTDASSIPSVISAEEMKRAGGDGAMAGLLSLLYLPQSSGDLYRLRKLRLVLPSEIRKAVGFLGWFGWDRKVLGQMSVAAVKMVLSVTSIIAGAVFGFSFSDPLLFLMIVPCLAWWIIDAVLILGLRRYGNEVIVLTPDTERVIRDCAKTVLPENIRASVREAFVAAGYFGEESGPTVDAVDADGSADVPVQDLAAASPTQVERREDGKRMLLLRVYGVQGNDELYRRLDRAWRGGTGPMLLIMDSIMAGQEFEAGKMSRNGGRMRATYRRVVGRLILEAFRVPYVVGAVVGVLASAAGQMGGQGIFWMAVASIGLLAFTIRQVVVRVRTNLPSAMETAAQSLFIDNPHEIHAQMEDGRNFAQKTVAGTKIFNLLSFYCSNSVWKSAMRDLARRSDAVVMDLRGYGPSNKGCAYELGWLHSWYPLDRVALLVDERSDLAFINASLRAARRTAREASPDKNDFGSLRILRLPRESEEEQAARIVSLLGNLSRRTTDEAGSSAVALDAGVKARRRNRGLALASAWLAVAVFVAGFPALRITTVLHNASEYTLGHRAIISVSQPVGSRLFAVNGGSTLMAFDITSGRVLKSAKLAEDDYTCVAQNRDGSRTVVGSDSGRMTLLDARSLSVIWSVTPEPRHISFLAFAANPDTIVSCGMDGMVMVVNPADGSVSGTYEPAVGEKGGYVYPAAVDPAGSVLALAEGDTQVELLDCRTARVVQTISSAAGFAGQVSALAFGPDGTLLYISDSSGNLTIFTVRPEYEELILREVNELSALLIPGNSVNDVVVIGACDGDILGYQIGPDKDTFAPIGSPLLQTDMGKITSMALSPDGRFVLAGDASGRLRRMDLQSMKEAPFR